MSGAKTMQFAHVDGLLVGVHAAVGPSEHDWAQHCEHVERLRHRTRGVLVFTQGGRPTLKQRAQLRSALREVPAPPTAVLTPSTFVRGLVSSLSWFGGDHVAAFAATDVDGALHFLAARGPAVSRDEVIRTLTGLANELALTLPEPKRRESIIPPA